MEVAAFFLATVYLPLADVITYYLAGPIFVTAMSGLVLGEHIGWRRWTAILVGFCGVLIALRPSAQTISLAGDDRARRQPVVRGVDADHALAARDARYRAGDVAIRRHLHPGPGAVAVRLGDADGAAAWCCSSPPGLISVAALFCVNRSLKLAPASVVVPYQYSMIVWAVIFGFVVFGDVPSWATIIGASIIIAAGLYIFVREQQLGREQPSVIRRRICLPFPEREGEGSEGSRSSTPPPRAVPALQRGPDAARQAEAVDRARRAQRLEAVQLDAAPLEAALLEDVARRRVDDAGP